MCVLTFPKCNAQFMDQICRIYTPEKSKLAQTVQIELSTNSNTARSQIRINAQASGHLRYMLHDSNTQLIRFTD